MFRFKHFALHHAKSTLKIGTDSVLLGAATPINNAHRILDIGCGCGVIGFCIADRLRRAGCKASLTGIDIDSASVEEAEENARCFPPDANITFTFQHLSLQQFAKSTAAGSYDLIVSNPPYFVHSLKPSDEKRLVSRHRDSNLSFNDLVLHAATLLSPTGRFYLILPTSEEEAFEKVALAHFHLIEKTILYPVEGKKAHRIIWGGAKCAQPVRRTEVVIRAKNGDYHESYRSLTQEFYLNF